MYERPDDYYYPPRRTFTPLRVTLFGIILFTLPFYCVGFFLWGTANRTGLLSPLGTATWTPIGLELTATVTGLPTQTGIPRTATLLSPLQPTPLQFIPIQRPQATATPFVFIPTSTLAPTLTFPPTFTPPPAATQTPLPTTTPLPTLEPPTSTPLPTSEPPTPEPLPTDPPLPSPTPEPLPTDPPLPTVAP
jgi:hypothetical protein